MLFSKMIKSSLSALIVGTALTSLTSPAIAQSNIEQRDGGGSSSSGSEEEKLTRSDLPNNGEPFLKKTGQTCLRESPSGRKIKDYRWVTKDYDLANNGTTVKATQGNPKYCGNPNTGKAGDG